MEEPFRLFVEECDTLQVRKHLVSTGTSYVSGVDRLLDWTT